MISYDRAVKVIQHIKKLSKLEQFLVPKLSFKVDASYLPVIPLKGVKGEIWQLILEKLPRPQKCSDCYENVTTDSRDPKLSEKKIFKKILGENKVWAL